MSLNLGEDDDALFSQSDVRETAGVEANLNAQLNMNTNKIVGVVDPTGAQDAATKNYVDGGTFLSAGEGIDLTGAAISGEDATTANKGIANFAAGDFGVAAGEVSIDDDFLRDISTDSGALTPVNHQINILGGEGMNVTHAGVTITITAEDSTAGNKGIVIVGAGEGIDVAYAGGTATVSGEDATTANKGIASFNTDDFSVSSGAVSLKNKTSYWSCSGAGFAVPDGATGFLTCSNANGKVVPTGEIGGFVLASVNLPHGAVVTDVITYGTESGNAWKMIRVQLSNLAVSTMANANINVEDSTITNGTIDNSTYAYFIAAELTDAPESTHGARITYTTDYI